MRETETIDPMWEGADGVEPGPRIARLGVRWVGAALKRFAPAVVNWTTGMAPELQMTWGARVYHLRRDGIVWVRRSGPGYDDNPRRNYNEAVERRQQRENPVEAEVAVEEDAEERTEEPVSKEASPLDLSVKAMQEEVARAMGITEEAAAESDESDEPSTAESVKERLIAVRSLLQSLDDVSDWDLVEEVDEELYLLHKAVEYKMRNHKASAAKAQLDNLFK
jgi:hypothetical protein